MPCSVERAVRSVESKPDFCHRLLGRLKELCRAFDCDDSGRKKVDLAARLMPRPVSAPPTPTTRPALSVRQPWAWPLLYGGKTVENRTWSTPHRGPTWIHAPARENRDDVEKAVHLVAQSRKCDDREAIEHYREHAQRGAILGSMTLTACRRLDELDRSDPLRSNPWADGPWLWLVTAPVPRDPWPTPGRLRLWMPCRRLVEAGRALRRRAPRTGGRVTERVR